MQPELAPATPDGKATESTPGDTVLTAVIVSQPGIGERSLRATLGSLPGVRVTGMAVGCLTALQMVRDQRADLVVVDANQPFEEVHWLLRLIGQQENGIRTLVLVETTSQVWRALAAGADAALRWDASINELSETVTALQ